MAASAKTATHAAMCFGVKVPHSPMLNPQRIDRINAGRYEGQEIEGALHVVQEGDRVLELGAGLGIVGAVVAKNAKPAKVLSFEANPGLIEHITALYRLNRLGQRIEVRHEVLLSAPDAPQSMPFFVRNSYLGSSLLNAQNREATQVEVPTVSFAKLQEEFAPDVMLIDIEGGELEFLKHASLDGVRAIVIEFHPEQYGKDEMRTCKAILTKAGFQRIPEHSTNRVWTCARGVGPEAPHPDQGWSTQVETVEGAVIVPPVESGLVQVAGVLSADGSYCPSGALWRNGRELTTAPAMPDGDLSLRAGTWLWGGVLWMHFGHFLVESLARAWALAHLDQPIDGILFMPKRPKNKDEVAGFQTAMFEAMGADVPLVCIDAPERVERLIVPGQGFGLGQMSTGTDAFRAFVAERFGRDIAADGPEKLYISRSLLPSGRGNLIGETELEQYLEAEGYTIYHPQEHGIAHQIATYKAARQIIAAEGSALHMLAMVAHPDCTVAMVVRRPSGATRNIERHLEAFSGRKPASLVHLRHVWRPKGPSKPRNWMGELDFAALQTSLREAGLISQQGETWASLDPETVRERLGQRFEQVPPENL